MICNKAHLSQHCLNFLNRDQSATAPKKGANKSLTNESGSVQSPENDFYFPVKPIRATKNSFKAESSLDHSSELRHTYTHTHAHKFLRNRGSAASDAVVTWFLHLIWKDMISIHPCMFTSREGLFIVALSNLPECQQTHDVLQQSRLRSTRWSGQNVFISSNRICLLRI